MASFLSTINNYDKDTIDKMVRLANNKAKEGIEYLYRQCCQCLSVKNKNEEFYDSIWDIQFPDLHRKWFENYSIKVKGKRTYIAVIAPRGFAKSTTVKVYVIEQILSRKENFVVVLSATDRMSTGQLSGIKTILGNEELQEMYNYSIVTYNQTEIILQFEDGRKSYIVSRAISSNMLGLSYDGVRPGLLILDDIEGMEQAKSITLTNQLYEKLETVIIPLMGSPDRGKVILIGTTLTSNALANRIIENQELDDGTKPFDPWHVFRYSALDENDKSIWEEVQPTEALHAERERMPGAFAVNYMNMPVDKQESILTPELFNKLQYSLYNFNIPIIESYAHFDLNNKDKETSDFFAGVLLGKDIEGKIYVLDIVREKPSIEKQTEIIINKWQEWREYKIKKITIDGHGYQGSLKTWIDKQARAINVYPVIEPITYKYDKMTHFKSHEPVFTSESVLFPMDHQLINEFKKEILSFPHSKHDDMVDAFSFAMDNLTRYKKKKKGFKRSPVTTVTRL